MLDLNINLAHDLNSTVSKRKLHSQFHSRNRAFAGVSIVWCAAPEVIIIDSHVFRISNTRMAEEKLQLGCDGNVLENAHMFEQVSERVLIAESHNFSCVYNWLQWCV